MKTFTAKTLSGVSLACLMAASFHATADEAMVAAGQAIFAQRCHACHSEDPSKNTFGPQLNGVYERKAASLPRFAYSQALKDSGLVWSEENLRLWIESNDTLVPNTRMRHVAITDRAEQDYLLAFLKSL